MSNPEEYLKEEPTIYHDGVEGVAGLKEPESELEPEPEPEPEPESPPAKYVYRDFAGVRPSELKRANVLCHDKAQSQQVVEKKLPAKLALMLADPDLEDVLTWMPHGRSWRVIDKQKFMERCAKQFFGHSKYESFARTVNGWGFRRIKTGPDRGSYYHELFLRGMPHLHERMKRIPHGKHKVPVADENVCPDFYELAKTSPLPEFNNNSARESQDEPPEISIAAAAGGATASAHVALMPQSAQNNLTHDILLSLAKLLIQNQQHPSLFQQPFVFGNAVNSSISDVRGSNSQVNPAALSSQQLFEQMLSAKRQEPNSSAPSCSGTSYHGHRTTSPGNSLPTSQQIYQMLSQNSHQQHSNGDSFPSYVNQSCGMNSRSTLSCLTDQKLQALLLQCYQGQHNAISFQLNDNGSLGEANALGALLSMNQVAGNAVARGDTSLANSNQARNANELARILLHHAHTAENATRVINQAMANNAVLASNTSPPDGIFPSRSSGQGQVANHGTSRVQMNNLVKSPGNYPYAETRNPQVHSSLSEMSQRELLNQLVSLKMAQAQTPQNAGIRSFRNGADQSSLRQADLATIKSQGVATSRNLTDNARVNDNQERPMSEEMRRIIMDLVLNGSRNNTRG